MANLKKHQTRKSTIYLTFISGCITVLAFLLLIHPHLNAQYFEDSLKKKRQLVKMLKITDLCLFTEARYTRHLSQADLHSAFQDHPMAFEHFPSGSLVLPPVSIHRPDEIIATEISLGRQRTRPPAHREGLRPGGRTLR